MSNKVLFTTPYTVKGATPIESNVNDDIITPYILRSQETYIQKYLGTDLYNKLKDDVVAETITGTYLTLLNDYVIPCLNEWTFYEVLPFISMKMTNKTLGRLNADYISEGDLDDLKYLRASIRDVAEFYANRLMGFLKENSTDLPEYLTNNGSDKVRPQFSQRLFGGIFTGGSKSCDSDMDYPENRRYY